MVMDFFCAIIQQKPKQQPKMLEFETKVTETFKVKSKGFERIFSNYNSAYTVFEKMVSSEKKKKQAFTVTLSSKTGYGSWQVIDKTVVKPEFFD
jgi:hypothetical protein